MACLRQNPLDFFSKQKQTVLCKSDENCEKRTFERHILLVPLYIFAKLRYNVTVVRQCKAPPGPEKGALFRLFSVRRTK